ncbi:MAG: sensor domain-containing diguanylate cyclase [Shewanella sp.]|nr:sensor domain-containing diguanylate cyclase [Shewanella sp.]MCF1430123.1 sensor domain-containing diguanylate cyclase [Shewanella sp.]MCF1438430.1 sensor domain-containing diguanylate cyclase [Shewanella sp.]MCF1458807.1 sensor domain-containing diguanylate cyclase [Shewanella sp.]
MSRLINTVLWLSLLLVNSAFANALSPNREFAADISLRSWVEVTDRDLLSLNEVMQLPDRAWDPVDLTDTQHISDSQLWYRLTMDNGRQYQYRLLALDNPLLNRIELFHLVDNKLVEHLITGDSLPFEQGKIDSTALYYPIEFEPYSNHTLYIRMESPGAARLNMQLQTPTRLIPQLKSNFFLGGAQLGALTAIGLLALFIAITSRSSSYAYYSGYVLSMTLMVAAIHGHAFQFLWPGVPQLQSLVIPFLIPLVMAFAVMFTEKVLRLKKVNLRQLQLSRVTAATAVLLSLTSPLMSYDLAIRVLIFMVIGISCMLMFFALDRALRGDKLAKLYSIGWCTMLGSALYTGMLYLGLLQADFKPQLPVMAGLTFEVLFMAAVLIVRYNDESRAKQDMQQKALEQTQRLKELREQALKDEDKTKQKLERMVQERTLELEITLRELNEANQKLTETATIDSLTQLKNRRAFDKRLTAEGRISRRQQTPIALLMADIDGFKGINDQYGHLVGDEILRQLAEILQSQLKRSNDLLSRFGGEEFAIILPNTSAEGALQLAEQTRQAVMNADIRWQDVRIPLTISVGASATVIESDQHPKELLEQADKALYQAKQSGRNRACLYSPRDTRVTEFRSQM